MAALCESRGGSEGGPGVHACPMSFSLHCLESRQTKLVAEERAEGMFPLARGLGGSGGRGHEMMKDREQKGENEDSDWEGDSEGDDGLKYSNKCRLSQTHCQLYSSGLSRCMYSVMIAFTPVEVKRSDFLPWKRPPLIGWYSFTSFARVQLGWLNLGTKKTDEPIRAAREELDS